MLTTEELLKPRVIADYPKSIYEVGTIINAGTTSEDCIYCDREGPRMRHYPHLFQPLPWYKERPPEDMPEYVKHENGGVFKVVEHCVGGCSLEGSYYAVYKNLQPASREEYEAYHQQKLNP